MASFTLSFSSPAARVHGWPGARALGTRLVGSVGLSTGWTGWVTVRDEDVPAQSADAWAKRKEAVRFQAKDPNAEPFDIRAIAASSELRA